MQSGYSNKLILMVSDGRKTLQTLTESLQPVQLKMTLRLGKDQTQEFNWDIPATTLLGVLHESYPPAFFVFYLAVTLCSMLMVLAVVVRRAGLCWSMRSSLTQLEALEFVLRRDRFESYNCGEMMVYVLCYKGR